MLTVISKITTKTKQKPKTTKKNNSKKHTIRKNQGIKMYVTKYLIQKAVIRKKKI